MAVSVGRLLLLTLTAIASAERSDDYDDPPPVEEEPEPPMMSRTQELALKIGAGLLIAILLTRFVLNAAPPDKGNAFLDAKKKPPPKRLPKPSSGVNYLYRLARASEPTRTGLKGVKAEGFTTVGVEAKEMAKRAMMFRLSDGGYYGIAGLDDKCIHLSTADQVVSTANLYFKGVDDLLLLKFKTDLVEKDEKTELRWEEALPPPGVAPRPGVAFPHVYPVERGIKAKLSWWDLFECIELPLSADGEREFPDGWDSEEEVKQATWNGKMRADPDDAASDAASDIDQLANNLNRLEEKMRKEAGLS